MIGPGIYVVHYFCEDGVKQHATVDSHCSLAALGLVVEAERQGGRDVLTGTAELLCPSRLLQRK